MRRQQQTKPRTRERQDALEAAKHSGATFQTTGGAALNDDDYMISQERSRLKAELEDQETLKKQRVESYSRQQSAYEAMEKEEKRSGDYKALIAWKLGRPCPSKLSLLAERKAFYLEIQDQPVKVALPWTDEEEEVLVGLQGKIDSELTLEETQYFRDRELEVKKARSLVASLSLEDRQEFSQSILEESSGAITALTEEDLTEDRDEDPPLMGV